MLSRFVKSLLKPMKVAAVVTAAALSTADAQAQQVVQPAIMPHYHGAPPTAPTTVVPHYQGVPSTAVVPHYQEAPPTVPTAIAPRYKEVFVDPVKEAQATTTTIVGTPYPSTAAGENPFSGSVTLNQDSFFGFYPILSGAYAITDDVAFTFYGLFWTNPGFTPSGTGGTGLWTEFGGGVSFSLFDGGLIVNPQLGYLNGSLLSGSNRADTFDGLVTQVTISHTSKYLEAQVYGAYYLSTEAPSTNDFVHYWVTGGVRPFADSANWAQIVSVGAHFEQLYRTRFEGGESSNIYTWLGPYVQFTLPNNVFIRMSGGWDLHDNVAGTFYKTTIGYSF